MLVAFDFIYYYYESYNRYSREKAASTLDVLRSISYLKVIPLTDEKFLLMQEIKESVKAMNDIKSKKKTARNAREFLNAMELQ